MSVVKNYYLFGSRALTHIGFWLGYYLLFGFIWANDGEFRDSYYLEFILLPIRIGGTYLMIYVILPKTLLVKKYASFLLSYALLLFVCAIAQRHFMYFFYENHAVIKWDEVFAPDKILRAVVLINSTILLISGFKVLQLYYVEREKNQRASRKLVEIKSDKRTHLVSPDEIAYVKGMGNYVTYFLMNEEKIISYSSMKNSLDVLPGHFKRIHKSYIVNEHHVSSYSKENVTIKNETIPIGKSLSFKA
ncbi:MAG: LytTR family DNA-binding domain-containing protein [Bacteroidota bacterium]